MKSIFEMNRKISNHVLNERPSRSCVRMLFNFFRVRSTSQSIFAQRRPVLSAVVSTSTKRTWRLPSKSNVNLFTVSVSMLWKPELLTIKNMKKIIPCVIVFIAVVRGRVSVVEHRNSIFFSTRCYFIRILEVRASLNLLWHFEHLRRLF